jgi:hypothetical protein
MKKIFALAALALLLAGCSQAPSSTPTTSPTQTKTQVEIEADFLKIAADSCTKAQSENIVEKIADGSRTIVLARANAYRDYSAVYIDAQGKTQVIYEMDLLVCQPGYLISMQQEANHDNSGDYEHHTKLNSDGTYTWSQASYVTPGTLDDTVYTVTDGIITAAKSDPYDYTFIYGPVSDSDMAIFEKAIDDEIASQN